MNNGKTFGIISEGVTDQVVLENIFFGWTGDKNLSVTRLQPKNNESGNWDKVFKYCQSSDFKGAFSFCDIVVIQIDTDFMLKGEVSEEFRIDIQMLTVEKTIDAFKQKFISLIGEEFYAEYQHQILFAIAVNEIECWLLPIYYMSDNSKAMKTVNCIDTLNRALFKKEGFYINEKRIEFYEIIAKHFSKKQDIDRYAKKNPSFDFFIRDIRNKDI